MFTTKLQGIWARHWNSEWPIVFAVVVLQKISTIHLEGNICSRISNQMDLWDEGKWSALIDDTRAEFMGKAALRGKDQSDETLARAFNARVLSGRLQSAVRAITNRDVGGVLGPDNLCMKSEHPVLTELLAKHPSTQDSKIGIEGGHLSHTRVRRIPFHW